MQSLANVSGVDPRDLSSGKIGFGLAPRINAGGRLSSASGAVRLLLTERQEEADQLAKELDSLNVERQLLVEETVVEAEAQWRRKLERFREQGLEEPNVIVLAQEGWKAGIAGLVASKLVERYYKPAIVLAIDSVQGFAKGSARSIDGFDLYKALTACADLMQHYGGHQAAAGMTMSPTLVDELETRLHVLASKWLTPEDWNLRKKPISSVTWKMRRFRRRSNWPSLSRLESATLRRASFSER